MTTPERSPNSEFDARHEPVLVREVVGLLQPRPDGTYVDCTVGLGGHTAALLAAGAGRVIGLDRDPGALSRTAARLASTGSRLDLVHADYRELPRVLADRGLTRVDGVLADLGVSSMQLDDPARGFSFRMNGPLDMRMDPTRGQTAAEMIAEADESTLADIIYQYGEERHSRRVARAIVRARERGPLVETSALASVVRSAAGGRGWQRIDPATRTFQALRIWVNRELEGLDTFLESAAAALTAGGRLAVIAFHSLEDRIVKHTFRKLAGDEPMFRMVTRKAVQPEEGEVARNPRARSARLRVLEKAEVAA
jgi:16S rRNA (cytosine1402-N4)-methyltransferase